MKVGLKTAITKLPKKTLEGVNEIGASTRGLIKSAGNLAKDGVDKFVQTKPVQGLKKVGINKDTLFGIALIAIAINNTVRIAKNIKGRVDESKQTLK